MLIFLYVNYKNKNQIPMLTSCTWQYFNLLVFWAWLKNVVKQCYVTNGL
jgi:hypothetical protein